MTRPLPTDILVRDPVAQAVELPGGRLLVRHRDGISLFGGIALAEVSGLLSRIDGSRTAEEVAPEARRAAVLRALLGEMVHVRGLPAPGIDPADEAGPAPSLGVPGAEREVVFLEAAEYRRLLEIQEALRVRGRPALFVTPDPDGVRVGPATDGPDPGSGACLACSLLAALAPAGLPAGEALTVAGSLRTVRIADLVPRGRAAFLRRLAAVVAAETAAPRRTRNGVVLLAPDGSERALPTPRRADCPVCSARVESVSAPGSSALQVEALHVGIVGGGTAGCLAALAIRAKRPDVRVTLIRSPDIPVIGVGEATTPLMPQFLHADLGVGAEELFREVRPTFKLGIRFDWGPTRTPRNGSGGFPYPFGPVRTLEAATWDGDLDACSLGAVLMAAGVVPVREEANGDRDAGRLRASFGTGVAYHLDNRRLATFLERLARVRGVGIVEANVVGVETTADGGPREIVALVGDGGRRFAFDLYVDCSGSRSLLMGEALGSPFESYGASLFTDRALVASVPRPPGAAMPPFTRARTLSAGWSWSIPQPEGEHVGSVYSSAFSDAEAAARELTGVHPALTDLGGLRELRFRPGRRRHFWRGNTVALGNAYGFVEPLESTALHLLIRQIGLLVRHLPASAVGVGDRQRPLADLERLDRLDRHVGAFWDYVRWFLALHFRFNRRLDTPFWRACREEADVSAHGELLERFREHGPLAYQDGPEGVGGDGFDYPDPLWGPEGVDTLLLGQGVACRMPEPPVAEAVWRAAVRRDQRFAAACLGQEELLARLPGHPEVLEALEAGFRARGPAY